MPHERARDGPLRAGKTLVNALEFALQLADRRLFVRTVRRRAEVSVERQWQAGGISSRPGDDAAVHRSFLGGLEGPALPRLECFQDGIRKSSVAGDLSEVVAPEHQRGIAADILLSCAIQELC